MAKAAIIILAGTEPGDAMGRVVNALQAAREFDETDGDELELIFDGAGTQWIPELEDPDHRYHELYAAVSDEAGACDYCASAFGVEDEVDDAGVVQIDEHDGHPSIRSLVADGYEVITF